MSKANENEVVLNEEKLEEINEKMQELQAEIPEEDMEILKENMLDSESLADVAGGLSGKAKKILIGLGGLAVGALGAVGIEKLVERRRANDIGYKLLRGKCGDPEFADFGDRELATRGIDAAKSLLRAAKRHKGQVINGRPVDDGFIQTVEKGLREAEAALLAAGK